jgi:hypothetical protein
MLTQVNPTIIALVLCGGLLIYAGCNGLDDPEAEARSADIVHDVIIAEPSGVFDIDGHELDGTVLVSPTVEYIGLGVLPLIDDRAARAGVSGAFDRKLDGTSTEQLVCACYDSNGVGWTQQCGPGVNCVACCGSVGGTALKKIWIKRTP